MVGSFGYILYGIEGEYTESTLYPSILGIWLAVSGIYCKVLSSVYQEYFVPGYTQHMVGSSGVYCMVLRSIHQEYFVPEYT